MSPNKGGVQQCRGYIIIAVILRKGSLYVNADVFIFLIPSIMPIGPRGCKEMAVDISLLLVLLVCWGGHWAHGQGQGSEISCIILSSLADDRRLHACIHCILSCLFLGVCFFACLLVARAVRRNQLRCVGIRAILYFDK